MRRVSLHEGGRRTRRVAAAPEADTELPGALPWSESAPWAAAPFGLPWVEEEVVGERPVTSDAWFRVAHDRLRSPLRGAIEAGLVSSALPASEGGAVPTVLEGVVLGVEDGLPIAADRGAGEGEGRRRGRRRVVDGTLVVGARVTAECRREVREGCEVVVFVSDQTRVSAVLVDRLEGTIAVLVDEDLADGGAGTVDESVVAVDSVAFVEGAWGCKDDPEAPMVLSIRVRRVTAPFIHETRCFIHLDEPPLAVEHIPRPDAPPHPPQLTPGLIPLRSAPPVPHSLFTPPPPPLSLDSRARPSAPGHSHTTLLHLPFDVVRVLRRT
jgi:hypothetical protein